MAVQGFEEMAELVTGMNELNDLIAREFEGITRKQAESMANSLRAQYPIGPPRKNVPSGNLRAHVRVKRTTDGAYQVRSTARHAWIYERGTVKRNTYTHNANRGAMPKTNVFVRTAVRWRQDMQQQLVSAGRRMTVRGMTGTLDFRGD